MANWTAAQLRNAALERLGVKARGQGAAAEDAAAADQAWATKHPQLLAEDLINFAIGAIPEYAQGPLEKIIAGELAEAYGFHGSRLAAHERTALQGMRELEKQSSGKRFQHEIRAEFF